MSFLIKFITMAFLATGLVFVQTGLSQDFTLSGKVINFAGEPIPGATVELKKADKSTKTADDGTFTLTSKSTPINGALSQFSRPNFAVLRDGHLEIRLFENAPVSITAFSIGGKTLYNKKTLFSAGIHTVSIPVSGQGVYLLRVKSGEQEATFKTCSFETNVLGSTLAVKGNSFGVLSKQATVSDFYDILKSSNTGYLDYQTEIIKPEASDLVLRMAKSDFPKVTKGSIKKPPTGMVHSSTILELEDGTLLSACYGGSKECGGDVQEWVSRKPVGGEWSAPKAVANGKLPGKNWTAGNPVLFQPRGGDIMLFYHVIDCGRAFWLGRYLTSSDGGLTWSEIKDLGSDKFIGPVKNKPIQLADGTIISGSSTEDNNTGTRGWRAHIERSTDGGKTWEWIGPIPPTNIGAIQPTLMVYPPGDKIQMMCRTYHGFDRIAESWSNDGGKTWSELKASVLPNNNSGFDAVTLHDGRQLLAYNHTTRNQSGMGQKARGFLTIAISENGKEWSAALILYHSGGRYSYPSVIQARNGLVHVTSTRSRGLIMHTTINPALLKELVPMPDGKWPQTGPLSLAEFKKSGN